MQSLHLQEVAVETVFSRHWAMGKGGQVLGFQILSILVLLSLATEYPVPVVKVLNPYRWGR